MCLLTGLALGQSRQDSIFTRRKARAVPVKNRQGAIAPSNRRDFSVYQFSEQISNEVKKVRENGGNVPTMFLSQGNAHS